MRASVCFRATPWAQFFRGATIPMQQIMAAPYDYAGFTMPILHVTGWYETRSVPSGSDDPFGFPTTPSGSSRSGP